MCGFEVLALPGFRSDEYTQVKPSPLHGPNHILPSHSLCLHNPKPANPKEIYFHLSEKKNGVLAFWSIESLLTPPPHPLSPRVFPLIPFVLPGSLCAQVVSPGLPGLPHPPLPFFHSSVPLTLSPSALCVSPVSSFLKNGVSSGFTLAASRGIHGNEPVHGAR